MNNYETRCILKELVFQANKHFVTYEEDRTYLNNLNNYDDISEFCYEVLLRVYRSNPMKYIEQLPEWNSQISVKKGDN